MKRKSIRTRGKFLLSRFFQRMKIGDSVAVVQERSVPSSFPQRIQGRTGTIQSKRGRSYLVKIKDQAKEKTYILEPVHLKKIKTNKKNDN